MCVVSSPPFGNYVDIIRFGAHTPHGFVLPQVALGKRPLHIEGKSFLINTFSCAFLGDVGFHEMLDPSFWVTTII